MFREMDTELVIGQCKGEDDVIALCRNADAILNNADLRRSKLDGGFVQPRPPLHRTDTHR